MGLQPVSSTTYSRSDGSAILLGTYQYVRARTDILDADKLASSDRYTFDTCTDEERQAFIWAATNPQFEPPAFLRFNLADGLDPVLPYPGAVDYDEGWATTGVLEMAQPVEQIAASMGITVSKLTEILYTFSGGVGLVRLEPGTSIYRTIGLTASSHSLSTPGTITNRILHEFWEPSSPNKYKNEADWRAKTAVKAEWNGDYGHVRFTLKREVLAMMGLVGMQKIARNGNAILPGGAIQYFIPNLTGEDIVESIDVPLKNLILETKFGSEI